MTAGLRFFYRHIYVTGLENIPAKGPAIIIANHNSSLMDAALLGILLKRKAWFFARGDVFVNKPVQQIIGMVTYDAGAQSPGREKNPGRELRIAFQTVSRFFLQEALIVFFPESYSHTEHQLLPFRKGVFRLAFDTASSHNFSFEIPVVPIGITYDHPVACRTDSTSAYR